MRLGRAVPTLTGLVRWTDCAGNESAPLRLLALAVEFGKAVIGKPGRALRVTVLIRRIL
jgi:hypothetical protein